MRGVRAPASRQPGRFAKVARLALLVGAQRDGFRRLGLRLLRFADFLVGLLLTLGHGAFLLVWISRLLTATGGDRPSPAWDWPDRRTGSARAWRWPVLQALGRAKVSCQPWPAFPVRPPGGREMRRRPERTASIRGWRHPIRPSLRKPAQSAILSSRNRAYDERVEIFPPKSATLHP